MRVTLESHSLHQFVLMLSIKSNCEHAVYIFSFFTQRQMLQLKNISDNLETDVKN